MSRSYIFYPPSASVECSGSALALATEKKHSSLVIKTSENPFALCEMLSSHVQVIVCDITSQKHNYYPKLLRHCDESPSRNHDATNVSRRLCCGYRQVGNNQFLVEKGTESLRM
jgi:hypothetical protein